MPGFKKKYEEKGDLNNSKIEWGLVITLFGSIWHFKTQYVTSSISTDTHTWKKNQSPSTWYLLCGWGSCGFYSSVYVAIVNEEREREKERFLSMKRKGFGLRLTFWISFNSSFFSHFKLIKIYSILILAR